MKRKWLLLKILIGFSVLIFMIYFSRQQFKQREVKDVVSSIDYTEGNYFITQKVINDLLGKTHKDFPKMQLQRIDVAQMEKNLRKNPFVKKAEVFVENNGVLHTKITQESPVIRVVKNKNSYYITKEGKKIPLSKNFSAQVIFANGSIDSTDFLNLSKLAQQINESQLLKNIIIGIHKNKKNSFTLVTNDDRYVLNLGDLNNIEHKLKNFSIFYKEYISISDSIPYKEFNLNNINQIVAKK